MASARNQTWPRAYTMPMRWCLLALIGCASDGHDDATWRNVHATILEPNCATAGCHSTLTSAAGFSLASRDGAYTVLTGRVCGEPVGPASPARHYVTPFAPEASQLIFQLRGSDADGRPYRDVMPPDVPLPAIEVDIVARWIDEGAACE